MRPGKLIQTLWGDAISAELCQMDCTHVPILPINRKRRTDPVSDLPRAVEAAKPNGTAKRNDGVIAARIGGNPPRRGVGTDGRVSNCDQCATEGENQPHLTRNCDLSSPMCVL